MILRRRLICSDDIQDVGNSEIEFHSQTFRGVAISKYFSRIVMKVLT